MLRAVVSRSGRITPRSSFSVTRAACVPTLMAAKRSAAAVAQRRGHRSDALLQFLVDQRVPLASNRADRGTQSVDVRDRLRSSGREHQSLEKLLELRVA